MTFGGVGSRGSALMISVVFVAILIVATGCLLGLTLTRSKVSAERLIFERQLRAADAAIGLKISQITHLEEHGVVGTFQDGTRYAVVVRNSPGGNTFKLTAATLVPGSSSPTISEAVVDRLIQSPTTNFNAALISKQALEIGGGATVEGNCYSLGGNRVELGYCPPSHYDPVTGLCGNAICQAAYGGPAHAAHAPSAYSIHDKLGMASKGNVEISGTSMCAGCGDYVVSSAAPTNNKDELDGVDGNGAVIDAMQNRYEYGSFWGTTPASHFPTDPDQVIGVPAGSLKDRAVAKGTYFASKAAYDTWIANGGLRRVVPPNSVIYLDFQSTAGGAGAANLDSANVIWGVSYHVIVNHSAVTPEVIAPEGGILNATPTAYVDLPGLTLGVRSAADECTDATHGDYFGSLKAKIGWPGMSGGTTHVAGPRSQAQLVNEHVAGAAKWNGYAYVKTEPDGNSVIGSFHGTFYGVIIVDDLKNMNAGSLLYGGVASLQGDDGSLHLLINGQGTVKYSAAAIDQAVTLALGAGSEYRLKGYRESPTTRDAQFAAALLGVAVTVTSPEDAYVSGETTVDGWKEPRNDTVAASSL